MLKHFAVLVLAALATVALAGALHAQSAAQYRVTFESTWSATTHPDDFPPNPHFSGLVGGTHDVSAVVWESGGLASPGIESMAETGSKTALIAEVQALIGSGEAEYVLSGGGIGTSPGTVSLTFDITDAFSHVSLVSMLAPSPDWFVGVSGLDLYEGGAWVTEQTVDLYVYDAGTDSGQTYTAPNQATVPPEAISQHTEVPFLVGGSVPPVGTFTFTLLSATSAAPEPNTDDFALRVAPNPARGTTTLYLDIPNAAVVTAEVFDPLGRRAAVLHDGALPAGMHRIGLSAADLPGGVYIVRVRTEKGAHAAERVTLVR